MSNLGRIFVDQKLTFVLIHGMVTKHQGFQTSPCAPQTIDYFYSRNFHMDITDPSSIKSSSDEVSETRRRLQNIRPETSRNSIVVEGHAMLTNRPAIPTSIHDLIISPDEMNSGNDFVLPTRSINPQETSESPTVPISHTIAKKTTNLLFLSHFLSTWNSRLFEMGSVLFIAATFPKTLLPMSVYALVRSGATILLSPTIGAWIDQGNRLNVVRVSIVGQRMAVGTSCGIFWTLYKREELGPKLRTSFFVVLVLFACIEKLCSVMNLIAVERDWVVVISQDDSSSRRILNARMRRIDLFCKLFSPLMISSINGASTMIAIQLTLAMNLVSVLIEYHTIAAVFTRVPALRRTTTENPASAVNDLEPLPSLNNNNRLSIRGIMTFVRRSAINLFPFNSVPIYCRHPAFLPSISLSLLYLTVLSVSGQMITFLVAIGYTSSAVGATRAVSTIFELSATWIAPKMQERIGAVRGALWSSTWQMMWLAGGLTWFIAKGESLTGNKLVAASGLVGAVVLSRMGLWSFDLCVQSIIQEEVNEQSRGTFSTVEASFQNLFELLSYLTTIIFSTTNQFQWPAIISVIAIYIAGLICMLFVKKRRGHLISCLVAELSRRWKMTAD